MALRTLGLNTIAVQSLVQVEALKLKNVASIVVPDLEQDAWRLNGTLQVSVKTIIVPKAIFANIWTGDLPSDPACAPPFGGHVLFTSGTTGVYKKLLLHGKHEHTRNAERAQAYRLSKDTVYHGSNFGLWTTIGFRMTAAVWHVGGCVVVDNRRQLFSHFFSHAINFSILIPPKLKELVKSMAT